jgi:hypothetical protein
MGVIEYSSNNSGGRWWLSDDDWLALEAAGWVVHWIHDLDDPSHQHDPPDPRWASLFLSDHHHAWDHKHTLTAVTSNGDRWLGALARSAAKQTADAASAVAEWESVTGQTASDEGCNCCGPPHSFTFTDDEGHTSYGHAEVVATELRWS